jgi:hypothetical protein
MRSLGVCAILLALAIVAPAPAQRGPYEPLWALGALVLLALTGQNVLRRMRLPAVVSWILAGLILGPSLLRIVEPLRVPVLALCFAITGVWAGLLVGMAVNWTPTRRGWQIPVLTCASTLLTFAVVAIGTSLVTDLPLSLALILGAIASFWGPLLAEFWHCREVQIISLIGVGFAFLLLSIVLAVQDPSSVGLDWVARLWLAPALGAAAGEFLWRIRVLQRRAPALLSLTAWTAIAAFGAQHFDLPLLPLGLGTGLALAARQGSGRQLEHMLVPVRGTTVLLFAGLLMASADVGNMLWPIPSGLLEVIAVQVIAVVLLRGVGPALWYPLPLDVEFTRQSGWLLLPKGLVAGELVLAAGATLPTILSVDHGALLQAVVVADMLVFGLVFTSFAAFVPTPSPTPPVVIETQADDT